MSFWRWTTFVRVCVCVCYVPYKTNMDLLQRWLRIKNRLRFPFVLVRGNEIQIKVLVYLSSGNCSIVYFVVYIFGWWLYSLIDKICNTFLFSFHIFVQLLLSLQMHSVTMMICFHWSVGFCFFFFLVCLSVFVSFLFYLIFCCCIILIIVWLMMLFCSVSKEH